MTRRRLDAELVRRGLARSREQARDLVAAGRVSVQGVAAHKPATMVDDAAAVLVDTADDPGYASRGAHKLAGALAAWPQIDVAGRHCLDAGASTGGFTDVLLRAGAAHVVAVDVGYGQLDWRLRTDSRVTVMDRTNVRTLQSTDLPYRPDLVVADLSFISLTLVLPALTGVVCPDAGPDADMQGAGPAADMLLMVKPQFEVGREALGNGGVVRDPTQRADAVRTVLERAWDLGWGTAGVTASPLPGPSGNVEYFVWLRRDAAAPESADVERAIQEGP